MTRIPRTLDRGRKPRRAPQLPTGHGRVYQVFDETHRYSVVDEAFASMAKAATDRKNRLRTAGDVSWWDAPHATARQYVDALTRRIYGEHLAPDVTAFTRYMLGFDPALPDHLWAAATTPGWLQHAPQPDRDTTALAEASSGPGPNRCDVVPVGLGLKSMLAVVRAAV